jgi:hypothetical protein
MKQNVKQNVKQNHKQNTGGKDNEQTKNI